MAVALDANLLLHAVNDESDKRTVAEETLRELIDRGTITYLFWPVILAFVRVSTHPQIFQRPLTYELAVQNIEQLLRQPTVRSPGESERFWSTFRTAADAVRPRGNMLTDAHIVALMRDHGVTEILTGDRDFRKFDGIRVVDPFSESDQARRAATSG